MNKKEVIPIVLILLLIIAVFSYAYYTEDTIRQAPTILPDNVVVYSYGPTGVVSKQQGSEVSYYHKDHLGSNSLVSDSEGEIEYSSDYYPFGESYNSEGEERYTYTGKELDSSGLYYYGARYYDASLGRFISVDPVPDLLFSSYVYVRDNPMKYIDPSGMEWEPVDPGYSEGYFPGLSDPSQNYASPISLFFQGHPSKAARQWSYNLGQSEPWRFYDIVDIPATSIEFLKGETSWKMFGLALLPGALGSIKYINPSTVKSVLRGNVHIPVSSLDIHDLAHFPTRTELISLGYDKNLLDEFISKVDKVAEGAYSGKMSLDEVDAFNRVKISPLLVDLEKSVGNAKEIPVLEQYNLMLDYYRNRAIYMPIYRAFGRPDFVEDAFEFTQEAHKVLTEAK